MKYRIKKFTAYEIINLKAEQTIVTFYNKEKILFAPLLKVDGTLLITTKKAILESDEDIKLVPLSFFQSIKFILKLFTKKRRKNALVYDSIYVTFREKKQKKLFFKINNHFANYSINLENRELRENLEIVKGISNKAITFKKSERAKIAIVIHIYFKTTMSDFIPIINNNVGIDVIITTPILDLESHITQLCEPKIMPRIFFCENKGRDVRPFLILLENGVFDNYQAVCKVHGKKSLHLPTKFFGDFMRRSNLIDLIYRDNAIDNVIEIFQGGKIGLIGAKKFLLKANRKSDFSLINNPFNSIIDQISPEKDQDILDFFAGTMFWFRPDALTDFKTLSLSNRFDEEVGAVDLKLEHMVERIFNLAVRKRGYEVECV